MKNTPTHEPPEINDAIFLGKYSYDGYEHDLYFIKREHFSGSTFLAKYSNDPWDYISGFGTMLSYEPLRIAYKLALKEKLVPDEFIAILNTMIVNHFFKPGQKL